MKINTHCTTRMGETYVVAYSESLTIINLFIAIEFYLFWDLTGESSLT